ncbi:MAG: cob(I)yrinic acid a,c-diamide adenosyltransferase [Candidatus Levybacteria bacterium]|nr:cob(I)yrinic acid a,c-diamide adenosyltransferase [Candidatus Levybacteria bacterium]MBP9814727.1 cob(I)yrinic acid a,c-diamide adenosyltransferase [Candidatus Levybacteria bacterium]
MPIYTKTGDRGKTSLFSGKRVYKDDLRVETYGTLDELNSAIGLSISYISNTNKKSKYIAHILTSVQTTLFYIGSYFADLSDIVNDIDFEKELKTFEDSIDHMISEMPAFNNFVLPGGGQAGASLHVARTVARRLERLTVRLNKRDKVDPQVIKYINRLSDLLFAMARYANFIERKKETIWER